MEDFLNSKMKQDEEMKNYLSTKTTLQMDQRWMWFHKYRTDTRNITRTSKIV